MSDDKTLTQNDEPEEDADVEGHKYLPGDKTMTKTTLTQNDDPDVEAHRNVPPGRTVV